jgi:hypothetical protein
MIVKRTFSTNMIRTYVTEIGMILKEEIEIKTYYSMELSFNLTTLLQS